MFAPNFFKQKMSTKQVPSIIFFFGKKRTNIVNLARLQLVRPALIFFQTTNSLTPNRDDHEGFRSGDRETRRVIETDIFQRRDRLLKVSLLAVGATLWRATRNRTRATGAGGRRGVRATGAGLRFSLLSWVLDARRACNASSRH